MRGFKHVMKEEFQSRGESVEYLMTAAEQLEHYMEKDKIKSQWIKDLQKYQKKVYP